MNIDIPSHPIPFTANGIRITKTYSSVFGFLHDWKQQKAAINGFCFLLYLFVSFVCRSFVQIYSNKSNNFGHIESNFHSQSQSQSHFQRLILFANKCSHFHLSNDTHIISEFNCHVCSCIWVVRAPKCYHIRLCNQILSMQNEHQIH